MEFDGILSHSVKQPLVRSELQVQKKICKKLQGIWLQSWIGQLSTQGPKTSVTDLKEACQNLLDIKYQDSHICWTLGRPIPLGKGQKNMKKKKWQLSIKLWK